jgi:hypothetical protein
MMEYLLADVVISNGVINLCAGKRAAFGDIATPGRSRQLGARRLEDAPRSDQGARWVVMADPEGNEFCVCDAGQSG